MYKQVIIENEGVYFVQRDQRVLTCPFRQPIMKQNTLTGAVDVQLQPCNSLCPHFNITEKMKLSGEKEISLELTCSK